MTTYRRFQVQITATAFIIAEGEITESHPLNWMDGRYTRQGAWDQARSQGLPVTVVATDGTSKDLGVVFNPTQWEKAMYGGHISYSLSMTDGHYAPESLEAWLIHFRKAPHTQYNDARPGVLAALDMYTHALAA